ncbi:hypothetical protein [Shinella sp. BYT-45]|uniref:hypothetical protein n=1 Tax=Shinella sp. BYT-45 TaxID=3377377 RepID=UPI003980DBCC
MKKTVTIALASLLAVSPVAGIAYAQESTTGATADTLSTGSITADKVNVVAISSLESDDSKREDYDRLTSKSKDPAVLEQTQAELQSDPGLAEILASKNVQLQNVVEITTAADGGKIVYVK